MRKSMNDDCLSLSMQRGSIQSDIVNNNVLMKEFTFTCKNFDFLFIFY